MFCVIIYFFPLSNQIEMRLLTQISIGTDINPEKRYRTFSIVLARPDVLGLPKPSIVSFSTNTSASLTHKQV